jgi:hypothetical protein
VPNRNGRNVRLEWLTKSYCVGMLGSLLFTASGSNGRELWRFLRSRCSGSGGSRRKETRRNHQVLDPPRTFKPLAPSAGGPGERQLSRDVEELVYYLKKFRPELAVLRSCSLAQQGRGEACQTLTINSVMRTGHLVQVATHKGRQYG